MRKSNSATLPDDMYCKDCGWPIVDACCNDEFRNFKDAGTYDYWAYCSNKGCENHDGEGYLQVDPTWMGRVKKEPPDNTIKCDKCGYDIPNKYMDWDYEDEEDENEGEKYEFIVCPKCNHREEFHQ